MERETKENPGSGVTVSLQIPSRDPDLFKHKASDDVLSLLSRSRFDEFSIGDLARQTGHAKPTVGRAVDVLARNGLVQTESRGNQRLVRINRERLAVPDDPLLRIPQPEFHEPVKAAVGELAERLDDLLAIVLYGSVARGDADRRSDIDLWVLVSEGRTECRRTANEIELDLEDQTFENGRHEYDIDVEAVSSVPRYTEDVRGIIVSGITLYETAEFETVEKLLRNEVDDDA